MWIITKDHCKTEYDPRDQTGTQSVNFDEAKAASLVHRFRMYDDDDVLCYEGLANTNDSAAAFGPLDDFGTPNAGCTSIFYLLGEKWEML
jgi:hypothetical protein